MERISSSLVFGLMLAAAHAVTPYLGNNAILSQATRATVAANGDSHAVAFPIYFP